MNAGQRHSAWVRFKRSFEEKADGTQARSEKAPAALLTHLRNDVAFAKRWFDIWNKGDGKWGTVPKSNKLIWLSKSDV